MNINNSGIDVSSFFQDSPAEEPKKAASKKKPAEEVKKEKDTIKRIKETDNALKHAEKLEHEIDAADKHAKILQIQGYLTDDRFGPYLREHGFNQTIATLQKKSMQSLEDELTKIRVTISSKNAGRFVSAGVLNVIKSAEALMTNIYKVDGLAASLEHDDQFLDTLREIELEHRNIAYVDPKIRLAAITGMRGYGIHQLHTVLQKKSRAELEQLKGSIGKQIPQQQQTIQMTPPNTPIDDLLDAPLGTMQLTETIVKSQTPHAEIVVEKFADDATPKLEVVEEKAKKELEALTKPPQPVEKKKPVRKPAARKAPAVKKEPAAKKPRARPSRAKKSVPEEPEASQVVEKQATEQSVKLSPYTVEQLSLLNPESRTLNTEFFDRADNIQLPAGFLPSQ